MSAAILESNLGENECSTKHGMLLGIPEYMSLKPYGPWSSINGDLQVLAIQEDIHDLVYYHEFSL